MALTENGLVRVLEPEILRAGDDVRVDASAEHYIRYRVGQPDGGHTFAAFSDYLFKPPYKRAVTARPGSVILHLWAPDWRDVPVPPIGLEPFAQHFRLLSGGWSHGAARGFADRHPAWVVHEETTPIPATVAWLRTAALAAYIGRGGSHPREV